MSTHLNVKTVSLDRPTSERASSLPPALLTSANFYGTLAAVRSLGRAGIRVVVADAGRFGLSSWSRLAASRVRSPRVRDAEFIEWLLEFGRQHEPHVLLPVDDDTAWLYSLYRDELSRFFCVVEPGDGAVYSLLNKRRLYEHAEAVGLNVPRTWFPQSPADVDRCCDEARFPVIVKPVSQVLFSTMSKGAFVATPAELPRLYREFSGQTYGARLQEYDPSVTRPMVQEFFPEASTVGIYNLSSYARDGRLWGVRGSRKVLQRPRRLGVGICFEDAPVLPELAAGLERLVARVAFRGVFEVEFVQTESRSVLIDFNPRFYNQMGFDIARGLDLPLLAYFDAIGNESEFDRIQKNCADSPIVDGRIYVDWTAFRMLTLLPTAERRKWTTWYDQRSANQTTFAAFDPGDTAPFWLAMAQVLSRCILHPRNSISSFFLNRM